MKYFLDLIVLSMNSPNKCLKRLLVVVMNVKFMDLVSMLIMNVSL